ncbi:MAG: FtsX-like permease family protein, partial [Pricia sp.]|nr:FtsX-like permease family protein [Pricia sp.]
MFKNYLKIAWRNILRNKMHSAINIVGLAIAFSISILLFLTVYFQFSYDSFHKDSDRLFKTQRFTHSTQVNQTHSQMPLPIGPALKSDIAGIETVVRVQMGRPESVAYQDKHFEKIVTRADREFFETFNFPIILGEKTTVLSDIQSIALGESTAKAIFGEENPIGKEITIGTSGEQRTFVVSAVIEDCPQNSSIRYDAIARIESLPDYATDQNNWGANSTSVFVKIDKNIDKNAIEDKLGPFVENYFSESLAQLKTEHKESQKTAELLRIDMIPIDEVRFSGERATPLILVYAIMGLGIFILLIACFNFVNLNMAHSFKRGRELGVRKTLGAFKHQLFLQLWGEALVLYFIGFVLGMVFAYLLFPTFSSQFDIRIDISTLFHPVFLSIMIGIFLCVTLIAGGYPALKMANFRLVEILKGKVSAKRPGVLRNSLLISQFAISTLLICISVVAAQQLQFLREKPIGFDKEQVISIPVGNLVEGRKILERMRNELATDPNIITLTGAGSNLGRGLDRVTSRSTLGFDYNQNQISADWLLVDFGYLKTLGIPILNGRDFNPKYANDTINAVVVTESFVQALGETDPIGKYFGTDEDARRNQIIGIIPDFTAYSPSEKPLPIALHLSADAPLNYIFIKVQTERPQLIMDKLALVWEEVSGNVLFNGSFLDENLQVW